MLRLVQRALIAMVVLGQGSPGCAMRPETAFKSELIDTPQTHGHATQLLQVGQNESLTSAQHLRMPLTSSFPIVFVGAALVAAVIFGGVSCCGDSDHLDSQLSGRAICGISTLVIAVVYVTWMLISVELLEAPDAVSILFDHWKDNPARTQDLPVKLQGAFWMSDNPGQELGASFNGAAVDLEKRTVSFWVAGAWTKDGYMWTYDTNMGGWFLYLMDRVVFYYVFSFNEDWTFAKIYLKIFGLFAIPESLAHFVMQENPDGMSWQRSTWTMGQETAAGTYTLKKVIDENGTRLPAFAEMTSSVNNLEMVQGKHAKSKIQMVPKPLFR